MRNNKKDAKGIPQGSPISCVLANLYMLELDEQMSALVSKQGGIYRRYSDDILIVCPLVNAQKSQDVLSQCLRELRLEIKAKKTERRVLDVKDGIPISHNLKEDLVTVEGAKPLQYLGVIFDGKNYYLRHAGIARAQWRIVHAVKLAANLAHNKKLSGLPGKNIYKKHSRIDGTYRNYKKRAERTLLSETVKRQYSDRRVENFIRRKKEHVLRDLHPAEI